MEFDFHSAIHLSECRRCGWNSYEKLASHGHCANCGYSPYADDECWEDFEAIPRWALEAVGELQPAHKSNNQNKAPRVRLDTEPVFVSNQGELKS